MVEVVAADNAAAEQTRAGGAPPAAQPLFGAELFASLPQVILFMLMWHSLSAGAGGVARRAATESGGPAGSLSQVVQANQELDGPGNALEGAGNAGVGGVAVGQEQIDMAKFPMRYPMWQIGQKFELYVYLSSSGDPLNHTNVEENGVNVGAKGALLWYEERLWLDSNIVIGNTRTLNITVNKEQVPQPWRNESVFAHVYFVRNHADPMVHQSTENVHAGVINLVKHAARPKAKKTQNLISGEMSARDKEILAAHAALNVTEAQEDEIIPLWKTEIYLDAVEEATAFPSHQIPLPIYLHMKFHPTTGRYYPMMYLNEFWLTSNTKIPVNATLEELPLVLHFRVEGRMKWLMIVQWDMSMAQQREMGTAKDTDQDMLKNILLETNPVLLGVTASVSLLHTVFDFLAFKNDISFWRKVDNMQGLSVRSIFTNVITQAVILLYLIDNDTSWVILFSSGIGLLIEVWKVKKAMDVVVTPTFPFISLNYKETYKSATLKYDQLAMKYLSYVLYPLSLGFSVFSLLYSQHKSWYSWVLGSAVGCVYTFGFIMMTPQLFINYKLKSVAHLPWRAMVYKFLNTIIDDLFAFVIKMPTLHRLSVFRDDLIFLIYLYQRWAYRVDRKRANEFGLVAKDMDEIENESSKNNGDVGAGAATAAVAAMPAAADAVALKQG
mmetsp:Transcript_84225/g.136504  ORF Transcript_84225/g.136504 Transcript_84225/m.136504 type:complete len:667 (-) Transcript_84225:69-2069(-)|eukprot:CAMPEP_0179410556 /NCGR_PEP_ID=MMETSP0799-20121207/3360_1 /TAXON_ID=46947 /ORGANISM="Geminigera cryophila, Strain CCMP2564" /LENGTH=666 /DNA_ID=CAMNT_0021182433 /DNA_START=1 /DNA_END=2001 /DNA_ORIENTATION=+